MDLVKIEVGDLRTTENAAGLGYTQERALLIAGLLVMRLARCSGCLRHKIRSPALTEHVVVVGYGATGRSAVELLAADATIELTVIDIALDRAVLAASEGSTAVAGSGLDADLLERVGIVDADRVIVAVGDDEAAVRVTSLVRGLNPTATVCTAIREVGWEPVAVYLGADQAVNVSRLCGVVLGCSVVEPDLPSRIARFLDSWPQVVIRERPARESECGHPLAQCSALVFAARREGGVLWRDGDVQQRVRPSDRLMVLSLSWGSVREG
ncbi:potassium channel family protein [Nocardia fluminea]|uniref:potassium channel family protein n=1 Tax=Nocardia fluminea TaxID=134984 RepID=UPI0036609CD8